MFRSRIVLTVGLSVFFLGLIGATEVDARGANERASAGRPPWFELPQPIHELEGKWNQWIWDSATNGWISGGTYRVSVDRGALEMSIVEDWMVGSNLLRSRGLRVISYDGQNWVFDSMHDGGLVSRFRLRRVNRDTFEGYAYMNGRRSATNRWTRVR